ncbi:MAG: phenylalanine--tRNA ligase subunit alpha [Candidatus Sericytochromatia bacterium]|nr:phenylalanine--tRNA ligase subunit alpha [Candidatus Tanganyikabacteria bacterium]
MTTPATTSDIRERALAELAGATTGPELDEWNIRYLGRERGELSRLLKSIPTLPPAERKPFGEAINALKRELEEAFSGRLDDVRKLELDRKLIYERIDATLPGRGIPFGYEHLLVSIRDEMIETFALLGFEVAEGPEIEDDWHNFTALNTPEDHPARDAQDTFYLQGGGLLRTQTSSVQIRYMEQHKPPIRIIAPGRVYRRDTITPRHYPIFHQIEGLYVDRDVTFADLKGTLHAFARRTFGEGADVRLRPSFFPFTEPSAELDVRCVFCASQGCRICSYSGWIEQGGCGMVDPAVLKNVGIDPEEYTGFAFGMGYDRTAMLKYEIPDIRLFWESDLRFLAQFSEA